MKIRVDRFFGMGIEQNTHGKLNEFRFGVLGVLIRLIDRSQMSFE